MKNNNVAAANRAVRNDSVPEAILAKVQLIYEEIVANQQRVLHRFRWNLERLHHERNNKDGNDKGPGKRPKDFAPRGARLRWGSRIHARSSRVALASRYSRTCRAASCSAFFFVDPSALAVNSTSPFEPAINRASMVKVLRCSGPVSLTSA